MSIKLVRTQDDFYGMTTDPEGNIVLHKSVENNRNTAHFAINGVVSNHVYGRFDGQVVIVADPREMQIPSGFRPEDTWFAFDENQNINLRHAQIFAPIGMEVPEGLPVTHFDAGIPGERERVVNSYLQSVGVQPQTIGMWGWQGQSASESEEWVKSTTFELYGKSSNTIYTGAHTGSLDEKIETLMNDLPRELSEAQGERLKNVNGVDLLYTDVLDKQLFEAKNLLTQFKSTMPESVVEKSQKYLERIENQLLLYGDKIEMIKESFNIPPQSPLQLPPPLPGVSVLPPPLPGALPQVLPSLDTYCPTKLQLVDKIMKNRPSPELPPKLKI